MKLVFIATDFAPMLGGIAQFMYDLINELPKKNVAAIALPTPNWKSFDKKQKFPIVRLNVPERWNPFHKQIKWFSLFYFWQLLKTPEVGMVVCCHGNHALMLAAWLLYKIKKIPYAVFLHGFDIKSAQTKPTRHYYNALLKNASIVFPNGSLTAKAALDGGVSPQKMEIINPCINEANLTFTASPEDIVEKLKLKNKKIVLSVGRLVERKGFDMVIKALPTLLKTVPDAHYVIVGGGGFEPQLKKLVHDLGLTKHVTLVGPVPHNEVSNYIAICDVFVMVTREIKEKGDIESFGIVYLEANYLGKPVIAGSAGGVKDVVVDKETGLIINPHDLSKISEGIASLLQNPKLAKQLAENGRKRVIENFSCTIASKKMIQKLPHHLQEHLLKQTYEA